MNPQRSSIKIPSVILLVIIILSGLTWLNYRWASRNPGGADFLTYWMGTRSLLVDGISPYSETVTNRMRIAASGWDETQTGSLIITYPIYASVNFLPFAAVSDYILARSLWMTLLEIGLFLLAVFSLRIARWRIETWMLPLFFLFSLSWFYSIFPLITGSAAVLVAIFIALALAALRSENDEMAGALLALATIKPLMVILLLVFINLWAIVQRRYKLLFWFWGTLALLSFGGMFFLSDWVLAAFRNVTADLGVYAIRTPGEAFAFWWPGIGHRLGLIFSVITGILILWEWWLAFSRREISWFLWAACFTLAAGMWTGIPTEPANFIILLPALAVVFSSSEERWKHAGRLVTLLSMVFLWSVPWLVYLLTAPDGFLAAHNPGQYFPLPLFLIVSLYWVRWWAVRPRRPLLDQIRAGEEGI